MWLFRLFLIMTISGCALHPIYKDVDKKYLFADFTISSKANIDPEILYILEKKLQIYEDADNNDYLLEINSINLSNAYLEIDKLGEIFTYKMQLNLNYNLKSIDDESYIYEDKLVSAFLIYNINKSLYAFETAKAKSYKVLIDDIIMQLRSDIMSIE
jgi:hypothetical protein